MHLPTGDWKQESKIKSVTMAMFATTWQSFVRDMAMTNYKTLRQRTVRFFAKADAEILKENDSKA